MPRSYTDIHRRGDSVHNRIGQGDFLDNFPNSDRPLVGLPHFPGDGGAGVTGGDLDTSSADNALDSLLGLDNAFSVPASQTVDTPAGPQTVIVNPTVYVHGYLFNDLGKDGAVVYHEGTHSISTPIAGLEGSEGGALNEAQAIYGPIRLLMLKPLANMSCRERKRARQSATGRSLRRTPDAIPTASRGFAQRITRSSIRNSEREAATLLRLPRCINWSTTHYSTRSRSN